MTGRHGVLAGVRGLSSRVVPAVWTYQQPQRGGGLLGDDAVAEHPQRKGAGQPELGEVPLPTNRVIKTIARDAYGFRDPGNQR